MRFLLIDRHNGLIDRAGASSAGLLGHWPTSAHREPTLNG